MDTGLLILLTAVAGRLLIARLPHTRHKIPYWSGYHILFVSFGGGVPLLPPAFVIHDALVRMLSLLPQYPSLERYVQDIASHGDREYAWPLSIALISFFLAWVAPKVYERLPAGWRVSTATHIRRAAEIRGGFMEIVLTEVMEAYEKGEPLGVELLLDNDVVCMGFVVESGITVAEGNSDIKLILVHRGYRDRNTGKFVIAETFSGDELEDYPVVTIPIRKIVSARKVRLD